MKSLKQIFEEDDENLPAEEKQFNKEKKKLDEKRKKLDRAEFLKKMTVLGLIGAAVGHSAKSAMKVIKARG
jgi:hypothetical protein